MVVSPVVSDTVAQNQDEALFCACWPLTGNTGLVNAGLR
jgi:hypothetical protein